jgi:hypothetical protein
MLLALLLAPFEHIHTGSGPEHDHGLVHSHFYQAYHVVRPATDPQGPQPWMPMTTTMQGLSR